MKKVDFGILINKINYSESSVIIRFFTKGDGLKSFIYKGFKKKKNRAIFPLSPIEIQYYQRNDSTLSTITEANLYIPILDCVFNPIKSNILFFQAEVLQNVLHEQIPDLKLYEFIEKEILHVETQDIHSNYLIYWLLELSKYLGFYPNAEKQDANSFNLKDGTFEFIIQKEASTNEFGQEVKILFELVKSKNAVDLFNIKLNTSEKKKILEILLKYYKEQTPNFKDSKSIQIINEIWYD